MSAIVTTAGRPSTLAAVSSALAQTLQGVEVIVVFDGPADEWVLQLPESRRVRMLATGHRNGVGGPARAAGTEAARGEYIAFLDDDDIWVPKKLETQMRLVAKRQRPSPHVLVGSRVYVVDPEGRVQLQAPTRLIDPGESVTEYLFDRRRVRWGGSLFHPSTILCDRAAASDTAWSDRIHEDWDWLMRLTAREDMDVLMATEPLTLMTESLGSASRAGRWRESLDWATANRGLLTDAHWANILLCTTAAFAKTAHERRHALRIGYHAIRFGQPSLRAVLFFVVYQLAPSHWLTRLARFSPRAAARSLRGGSGREQPGLSGPGQ